MSSPYRFLLAFHLIAVISWMAGLLYIWRLFIYHVEESEPIVKERFKIMERRLYRIITVPAMMVALLLGIAMILYNPNLLGYRWVQLKLFFAFLMIGITHMAGGVRRRLETDECRFSSKALRFINEVPTLLMILIVLLVILQPF